MLFKNYLKFVFLFLQVFINFVKQEVKAKNDQDFGNDNLTLTSDSSPVEPPVRISLEPNTPSDSQHLLGHRRTQSLEMS